MSLAYDLLPQEGSNYYQGYDDLLDPRLTNEFVVAAFRHGHSLGSSAEILYQKL